MSELPKVHRNFVGAISLGNWIKRNHFDVSPKEKVNVAEGRVWPAFRDAVSKHRGGIPIRLLQREELKTVSASLRKPEPVDHWRILVPLQFNYCHKRFAICKELCHILYEGAASHYGDPFAELSEALGTSSNVRIAEPRFPTLLFVREEISSESFCFLLAMELLIPIKCRAPIISDSFRGRSNFDIASDLRIPETLVDFYIRSRYYVYWMQNGGSELMP